MRLLVLLSICCLSFAVCLGQAPAKLEWGEKFNSPGSQLVLKETGRNRINGQTVVNYSIFASGLPKDLDYTLWTRVGDGDPQAVADAFINKDGRVVNVMADSTHNVAEDAINLKIVAGKGEPKRFAIISNDGGHRVFGQVIPFPIESAAGSCHISVEMLTANYNSVLIVANGFQAKEELQIDSMSEGESGQTTAAASDDGTYRSVIFTQVKGKQSGKTKVNISAKSCRVGVEFPWGQSSYHIQ